MPLLVSPIDGSPMRQIVRYGIEIDVCPTSGGMWLDKGEVEKLMAIIKEDAMNESMPAHAMPPVSSQKSRHYAQQHHRDYDDDDDHYYKKSYRHGKKSKISRIADIFDF